LFPSHDPRWCERAERYDAPLSSSGGVLNTRQSIKREVQREVDKRRIYNLDIDLDTAIGGGSNQPINKKHRLGNMTFDAFESELDITDENYPNIKKEYPSGQQ